MKKSILKIGLGALIISNILLGYVLVWEISSYRAYADMNSGLANMTVKARTEAAAESY